MPSRLPLRKVPAALFFLESPAIGSNAALLARFDRDPAAVFGDMDIPENIRSSLQTNIARRLTPQPVKIRSDIELTCFTYPGILAIKRALMKAAQMSTTEIPLDIRLIAPPLYVLLSNATDKNGAIERMEKAIQVIQESIESEGGKVEVQMKPKAVSESDELELEALMKRVQKENQEVRLSRETSRTAALLLRRIACVKREICMLISVLSFSLSRRWLVTLMTLRATNRRCFVYHPYRIVCVLAIAEIHCTVFPS